MVVCPAKPAADSAEPLELVAVGNGKPSAGRNARDAGTEVDRIAVTFLLSRRDLLRGRTHAHSGSHIVPYSPPPNTVSFFGVHIRPHTPPGDTSKIFLPPLPPAYMPG